MPKTPDGEQIAGEQNVTADGGRDGDGVTANGGRDGFSDRPYNVVIRLEGSTPLLMHNERMADPLDPHARALAEISKKTRKTIAEHERMARVEWEGAIYHDPDQPGEVNGSLGPYVPARQVWKMVALAGTQRKIGTTIERSLTIVEQRFPVRFSGPRDLDGLWDDGYWDRSTIVVAKRRVPRTRPKFVDWSIVAPFFVIRSELDFDDLEWAAERGGALFGVGDGRRIGFGRCNVTLEVLEP